MPIRFPLKTDVAIGGLSVLMLQKANEIFQPVPKVKWQYEHFGLLSQMNALVDNYSGVLLQPFITKDNERVERNARKTLWD